MATALRLRGTTRLQIGVALLAAYPFGYAMFAAVARHRLVSLPTVLLTIGAALLPWLSRQAARATYRAQIDDIAIHVRGEAVPYRTITEVAVEETWRRSVLKIRRAEIVELQLVLRDAFAGRLEPRAELERWLAASGHSIPDPP